MTGCSFSKDNVSPPLKPPDRGKGENQDYQAQAEDTMVVAEMRTMIEKLQEKTDLGSP